MTVPYRVFSQSPGARLDLVSLLGNARRYFEAEVEVLEKSDSPQGQSALLLVRSARLGFEHRFRVNARTKLPADFADAHEAEARGQAAGMAMLAERCPTVWEVEPESSGTDLSVLILCALLAATGLGPVLPPDGSTLYGVRGAMQRVEQMTERSLYR